jgi:hypothetical protein
MYQVMADIFTSFRLLKHQINTEKKRSGYLLESWVMIIMEMVTTNAYPYNFIMVGDFNPWLKTKGCCFQADALSRSTLPVLPDRAVQ